MTQSQAASQRDAGTDAPGQAAVARLRAATELVNPAMAVLRRDALRRICPIEIPRRVDLPAQVLNNPYHDLTRGLEMRIAALRDLGMPDDVRHDPVADRFVNARRRSGALVRIWRRALGWRECIVWSCRDRDGLLHAERGPAAVGDRGTLFFFRAGRPVEGPAGCAVIRADGRVLRASDARYAGQQVVCDKNRRAPSRLVRWCLFDRVRRI